MKPRLSLLIWFILALGNKCEEKVNTDIAPLHVCDLIQHIHQYKGQKVIIQGILSWGPSGYGLTDCRPGHCLSPWKRDLVVLINKAHKRIGSLTGDVDDSFDRMMKELPKHRIHKVLVTFEGSIKVQDEPFEPPYMFLITKVISMKAFPVGPEKSNYCK